MPGNTGLTAMKKSALRLCKHPENWPNSRISCRAGAEEQRMRREESSETDTWNALCEISVPLRLCGDLCRLLARILAQSHCSGANLENAVRGQQSPLVCETCRRISSTAVCTSGQGRPHVPGAIASGLVLGHPSPQNSRCKLGRTTSCRPGADLSPPAQTAATVGVQCAGSRGPLGVVRKQTDHCR